MKGYRTRWDIPDEPRESAEYVKAGARIALGQAVYDQRIAAGLSQAELASRAGTTQAVISQVEGGSVGLTPPSAPASRCARRRARPQDHWQRIG